MCNIWKPNADFVFPKTLCGAKKFSCNQEWFKKYEWLVYWPILNIVFCKYCSFFPSNSGVNRKLATKDVNYWKSCTFRLAKHMIKGSHGLAKAKYIGFKFITKAPEKKVNNQMIQVEVERIFKNREKLIVIIWCLVSC